MPQPSPPTLTSTNVVPSVEQPSGRAPAEDELAELVGALDDEDDEDYIYDDDEDDIDDDDDEDYDDDEDDDFFDDEDYDDEEDIDEDDAEED